MKKYFDLKEKIEEQGIEEAGIGIQKGELVLFPTETVYGIGANGLEEKAVKKIFIAKGRKQDNPLILHIANMKMLEQIAQNVTNLEQRLMEAFWPGPFTIILERKPNVPDIVTGGLNTVGIRMPSNLIAQKLIEYAKVPIAAPSANVSGRPSGTNIQDIFEELSEKVDYIIDGGQCEIGLESTVVRVINGEVHILRPGKITKEQIEKIAEKVVIDSHILGDLKPNEPVLSPGMKYKHYAPKSKCMLIYSKENNKLVETIKKRAKEYENPLIVCHHHNINQYENENTKVVDMGETLEEISKNTFKVLRKVDSYHPDIVMIEGVEKEGIGLAVMNRLLRACEHHYIEI